MEFDINNIQKKSELNAMDSGRKSKENEMNKYRNDDKFLENFFKDKASRLPDYGGDIENLFTMCKFNHSRRIFGLHPKNKKKINNRWYSKWIWRTGKIQEKNISW